MDLKKKNILVGCGVLGLLFFGAFPASAEETDRYGASLVYEDQDSVPVAIDVTAVYGKAAKLGSFVPLKIRLYGQSESEFRGTLLISTLESDNNDGAEEYEYSWPVDVRPAETKTMEIYVPLGQKNGRIYLTLKDEKNKTMGETSMDFDVSKEESRLFIGTLDKKAGALGWLDGVGLNYGMIMSKSIDLSGEDFPDDPRGLSMFDVLIVNDYDCTTLSDLQKDAVMEWVDSGGTLLLGTGRHPEKTLGLFDGETSAITAKEPETLWVGMGTEYSSDSPVESELCLTYAEPVVPGGSERMVTDGTPLLKIVSHGNGRIGVYGIDLKELSAFVQKNPSYVSYFLGEMFNENELNRIYYYSYGRDADYWNAQNLVSGGSAKRLPNLPVYGIVMAGYLIIAGPGLYLILKKRGLNRYYGGAVLAFSAFSCVVIWGMGVKTRFTSAFCTSATILDVKEDDAKERTFLNIRTPDSSGFSVKVSPDYTVAPLTRSGRYDVNRLENYGKKRQADIRICEETDDTAIIGKRSKAFDSRFFLLERTTKILNDQVEAELTVSDGKISGYVENRLPVTLENAAVYLYGQVAMIGDMEPGQKVEFDKEELLTWPVGMTWLLANRIAGDPDREDDSNEEYIENMQKSGLGGYFADRYYSDYNPEVRIGGFVPSSYEGFSENFGDDPDSRIFYTKEVSCQMGADGKIYRSGQMVEPTVTSTMGTSYGNAMILYGSDPMVVEYDPGTDLQIETYSFLTASKEFFDDSQYSYVCPFEGEASFYNVTTGMYDQMDIRKQDFSREELNDYIAADGKITVRYSGGADADNGVSQALPVLMVTGREN